MPSNGSSEEVKDILLDVVKTLNDNVEYADVLFDKVEGVSIAKDNA